VIIPDVKDIELLQGRVRDDGMHLLQKLLSDVWFEAAKQDCKDTGSGRKEEFDPQYFPIDWFVGLEEWEYINEGLKLVDQATRKKKLLRNLVNGILDEDEMQSSANALALSIVCRFAYDGVLRDIEPKISDKSGRRADALVNISGREVLVEATRVTKDLVSQNTTMGALSVPKMMNQTTRKLVEKAEQLDGAEQPAVVISTYAPRLGTDPFTAEQAVIDNIHSFPKLSAVMLSANHQFRFGDFYPNDNAAYCLSEADKVYFSNLLRLPPMLERLRSRVHNS